MSRILLHKVNTIKFMEIFGTRLKELRQEKRLSMIALAKQVNISNSIICRYENDKAEPTAPNIIALADFFGVTTDYLLGRENDDGTKLN